MTYDQPYSYRDGEGLVFVGSKIRFKTNEASFQLIPRTLLWATLGARSSNQGNMRVELETADFQFGSEVDLFEVRELLELSSGLASMLAGQRDQVEFAFGYGAFRTIRFAFSRDGLEYIAEVASSPRRDRETMLRDPEVDVSLAFRLTGAEIGEALRDLNEMLRLCDRYSEDA